MRTTKLLTKVFATLAAVLVVLFVTAPPSMAAPTMDVSALTGLKDGQVITITGGGFQPNLKNIAIGQCIVGYTGPAHCNTSGGAQFRNADASGSVGTFTITVKEKFGAHDCTKVQCVIAGAPLPTAADAATVKANTVEHKMSFGAAAAPPAESTAPAATAPTTAPSEIPKTGAGDSLPVFALMAGGLIAAGVGVVLLVPATRREVV